MDDVERVVVFRNRLVAHVNFVRGRVGWRVPAPSEGDAAQIASEQVWLNQEYGRLHDLINRHGGMSMSSPALGVTSYDVVADAINDIHDSSYYDITRFAMQHVDTVIGRLQADAERLQADAEERARARHVTLDKITKWTSPVYWIRQLLAAVRWLLATKARRIATGIGTVLLVVLGNFVRGWAEAIFTPR